MVKKKGKNSPVRTNGLLLLGKMSECGIVLGKGMSFDELIFSNGRWYTTPGFQAKYKTPEHDRTGRGVKNLKMHVV